MVCKEWGVDPGSVFEDDFLAWQMRLGLASRLWISRQPDEDARVRMDVARAKQAIHEVEQMT